MRFAAQARGERTGGPGGHECYNITFMWLRRASCDTRARACAEPCAPPAGFGSVGSDGEIMAFGAMSGQDTMATGHLSTLEHSEHRLSGSP